MLNLEFTGKVDLIFPDILRTRIPKYIKNIFYWPTEFSMKRRLCYWPHIVSFGILLPTVVNTVKVIN